MAGGLADLDTTMPERKGNTDNQIKAVYDYLVLLLENLRYILRNLGPENMNESEILPWLNDKLEVKTLISNTVITNELYADYGAIADLTVDELRTDYDKAQRYLNGDTSALDYLYIHDEQIEFRSGTVHLDSGTPATEQLHHRGRYFWWTDNTKTQMTSMEITAWPVIVYVYDELIKGAYRFETVTKNGTTIKVPVLVFGAGTGDQQDPDIGKAYIRKTSDSFELYLHGAADNGIFISDLQNDKYVDIVGLRKTKDLDFSLWGSGTFTETLDGKNTSNLYTVAFDSENRPVKITDKDGHVCTIEW